MNDEHKAKAIVHVRAKRPMHNVMYIIWVLLRELDPSILYQSAHPYFNRVSFGEGAKYYAEGAYLASHHWNKVVSPCNQL